MIVYGFGAVLSRLVHYTEAIKNKTTQTSLQ